jgi:hypothetical protein
MERELRLEKEIRPATGREGDVEDGNEMIFAVRTARSAGMKRWSGVRGVFVIKKKERRREREREKGEGLKKGESDFLGEQGGCTSNRGAGR